MTVGGRQQPAAGSPLVHGSVEEQLYAGGVFQQSGLHRECCKQQQQLAAHRHRGSCEGS